MCPGDPALAADHSNRGTSILRDKQMICDIPGEEWRPVSGFEGVYDVSNKGRVATYRTRGLILASSRQRVMLPGRGPNGYLQVTLKKWPQKRQIRIHRLVLETFVGQCPPGMETIHLDNNKSNNCVENLKWGTHQENTSAYGSNPFGEKIGTSKLVGSQVREIISRGKTGESHYSIARDFPVNRREISRIISGVRWVWISRNDGDVLGHRKNFAQTK